MKAIPHNLIFTIVGMGLTGLSCARFFAAKGFDFRIVDSRVNPPMKQLFESEFPAAEKHYGDFSSDIFSGNDTLVVSPGISLDEPAIAEALARGAILSSDIEIFLQYVDAPVVAITGSNGKSTVTTLVGEMFRQAGKVTCVAGNIGAPVLEQILHGDVFDVIVLELSSFQLERLPDLSAEAVTILNVTEDHMDRYAAFADYLRAKRRIFTHARQVVVNRDDSLSRPVHCSAKVLEFGMGVPQADDFGLLSIDGREWIVCGKEKLLAVDELKIRGRHNIANAMAAMALCRCLQLDWQPMLAALRAFAGLRHRCEWVADVNGISFYNDSKATNVGAAVAAIGGFDTSKGRLLLIAGGQDKDSDFSPMSKVVREKVSHVFLIGRDAAKLEVSIGSDLCSYSKDMVAAVKDAYAYAQAGDVVLLAPACASFDMFKNYEDRGDRFVQAVRELLA